MTEAHVATKIEAGAILYSSWGYDQTNIDYYMVTRTTEKSCWIVPMHQVETPAAGYSPMSGFTMPLEAVTVDRFGDAIKPELHKIHRYEFGESISLTSYSGAYLWDGKAKYASHYA